MTLSRASVQPVSGAVVVGSPASYSSNYNHLEEQIVETQIVWQAVNLERGC
jgi:hypothetical protein